MANVFSTATLGLRLDTSTFNNAIKASGLTTQQAFASMSASAEQFKQKWDDTTAGIKDTRRIISGILISQGFYGIMNAFTEGASAALTFSQNMETAAISTEYFVKGADKAAQSLAYLREMNTFAARTPFSTEAAIELSKYIQAVGISMNVSKSVLQVITDAAAATGATEETMQRIVFALGQMKTKGRIANEEIRQLANANVPIYEILQEELGLTGEQISNIGSYWIDADKAIVAILDGLEKRYAGAADRIADTMSGMVDTIVDDAKIIAYEAGDGIYGAFEDIVRTVRDKLDEYRDIATEFGAMGLFNEVILDIDPTGQVGTQLLTLVGDARQLGAAFMDLLSTSQPLIDLFGNGLYGAIGTVTVGATGLIKTIDGLEQLLADLGITTGNTGRMLGELFVMYQAGKWAFTLGQGALYAGQSLWQLGKATITSLVPSMAAGSQSVAGLITALGGLAVAALLVHATLNNLGNFGGLEINSGDILPSDYQSEMDRYMTEMKEYNDAIAKYQEQFNEPYTAIGEGTDKAIESYDDLKKASKSAAKSVQHDWVAAFDEVYQVPTFNDPAYGIGSAAELPELPDLGKLIGEITFSFPGIESDELKKPEFDWDAVFDNSFFDSDVFNGGWWKTLLPGAITAGLLGAATHFSPKGPSDLPTKPGSSGPAKDLTNKDIQKLLAEYDAQAKQLPELFAEAKTLLANGDPNRPGMYAATGVNSKSLIALADRIDAANSNIKAIEDKLVKAGVKSTELPAIKEQKVYALEAEKIQLELKDINRELVRRRKEAERIRIEQGTSAGEQAQVAVIETERRVKQLEKHAEAISRTPDGPMNAYKQQARIVSGQLKELGITERIKEVEQQLKHTENLNAGEIMALEQQLKDARKELKSLMSQYDVAPRYASMSPEQFVTEFGHMGDKLADNMAYILKTKYAPNAANEVSVFSVGTVKLLQQQLEEFQHMGAFAEKYYSSTLHIMYDTTGTAQRIYAAVLENNNTLKKTLNQLVKGTTSSSKPEEQPIVKLKDIAKKVTELTDTAIEQKRIAAMQQEADVRARVEAAKREEERRIAEEKARRQAVINDKNIDYSTKGAALDDATRADMAERFQHMITDADIEKVSTKLDKIIEGEDGLAAILNTKGTTHIFADRTGVHVEFDSEYSEGITERLEAILDVLDDYEPGEVSFTPKTTEALENILGIISGDTEEYYKRFEAYLNVPSKPVAPGTFDDLDIAKLIHTTVRDYLGYAPSGLLNNTPELLREREASKFVINLGDIAGMLEGSGPFGTAAGTATRGLQLIADELQDGLSLRDANYTTTVAGEITRQLGDLIKYSAGASLPSAGLNVYSGGLIKDAGMLLQVDAVAEGVVKGMSHTVPVQIIGVNGKVAEKIAKLASAPVGGVADIDAATLRALNKEAYYEVGALVNAFSKANQDKDLVSGLIAILNRDLSIRDTQYQDAFEKRMGSTFNPETGYRIFSPDAVMSYRNLHKERTAGLNAKELVADYMKQVVLPTFGFFPDLATGSMTETEAKRFAEIIQDINKTAQQFNGSINALKDATNFYMVEYTKPQLNQIGTAGNMVTGTNRHVQLLQDAYNTLGNTSELDRLLHSYAILNANAGELAGAVLEVDFSAPIRQYTFLRQNANRWASDLLKTNVKFSSGKAVGGSFISTVDGIMLEYFDALNNTTASELTSAYSILSAQTKQKLLDVANNTSKYFDLGADAELAKRALTALSENVTHIDPLSMNIRSYVDVISDINSAIQADLPVDELLRSKFDGLTRNASNLIAQFNLGANEWIQGYVRDLTNMSEQLRKAANGTPISEVINKPLEGILRIANASETADLATNLFGSLPGAFDDAIRQIADSTLTGVIPRPVHSVRAAGVPSTTNFNIIDLETFGLPQATKAGTVYPEIFSGAMFNPATKEMDRFYTLPDDILKLINEYGADNTGVKNAVDSYINQIRSINKEFRDVYGKPGMTEEVISRGISKSAAIDKLLSWTTTPGGFTGYNATNLGRVGGGFDTNIINAFTGADISKYALDDVMSRVTATLRRYTGTNTELKLTELREMFGISDDMLKELYGISDAAAHTAQADVLATNEVLKRVLDGTLDSIANTGKEGGWRYTNAAGDNVTGIKDVLINIGKDINDARLGDTIKQVADTSDTLDDAIQATVEVVRQATSAAVDTAQAAAESADKFRRATTAADLGNIAGTVGGARTAAIDDIGGPNLRNWISSRFSKLRDKIFGHQTVEDFFNATDAAGDTYEARIFNKHLFDGRKKSAPTFNDIRNSFMELSAADTKKYVEYGGQTMQEIRTAKNKADFAVAGGASPNADWIRQARDTYDKALKQSYGDVADQFYKDVVNHINGQMKTATQFNTFDDVLDSLNDDVKLFVATFDGQFGILGDTLDITARQLKNTAAIDAFTKLAKSGSFGKALKNSENIATAVGILQDALYSTNAADKATKLAELARYFGDVTDDAAAYSKTFGKVASEFEQLKSGMKNLDEVSDITHKFINNINKFGSNVAVMRSVPADIADAADDLLFAGKQASHAVNAAADTVSNSFKSLFSRAIDGVANFGLLDVAIAGVIAAIQHSVDEANKASLQGSMLVRDETGSVSKLAAAGFDVGKTIGDDIYHGAAEEFGNAIASGVVGSLGTTAGLALGGKVGDAIGTALGTAVAGPVGTIVGKLVGTAIGLGVGAISGFITDNVIDNMGGHSMTNLYLDDYLDALRDGSLITADALDEMCSAVGVTAEEIEELGQSAALAKHGVDVDAIEQLARNINTHQTMGSADYDKYMERDEINRVLTGRTDHNQYNNTEVAARIAAAYGEIDPSIFGYATVNADPTGRSQMTTSRMVINSDDAETINKTLKQLEKYTGLELEARTITALGDQRNPYAQDRSVTAVYNKETGTPIYINFSDLEGIPEAMRLAYVQGNTASDIAKIVTDVAESNKELASLVAENNGGFATTVAYQNLDEYLKLFNNAAGTNYTTSDISADYELGMKIQSFASQYLESGIDELLARYSISKNDTGLLNYTVDSTFDPGYLNNGSQTIWGADLFGVLPEYLAELSKTGFTLTPGAADSHTTLSPAIEDTYKYVTATVDGEKLQDSLTGWRVDMSSFDFSSVLQDLNVSDLHITAHDAEVLASAGIQFNGDSTVTFMKAEQAGVTGGERQINEAVYNGNKVSDYVIETLGGKGVTLDRETGGVTLNKEMLGQEMTGAMLKLPDDWSTAYTPEVKKALASLGQTMDSGYLLITDQAVLNGEKSIEAYVDGYVKNSKKLDPELRSELQNIDKLMQQEGNTTIENLTEWADAVVVPSPFTAEELSDDVKAMFEAVGIHFVEYGDQMLMQINQTGEHIKDGCVMLDREWWEGLVKGEDGEESTMGTILKELGVEWNEVGNQVMVDLSNTFSKGADDIVAAFVNKPEVWDQLPAELKQVLASSVVETDNGMLALMNALNKGLIDCGSTWLLGWEDVKDVTVKALDENGREVDKGLDELDLSIETGLAEVKKVITESQIGELAENELAIPISELPEDVREALTGPGGMAEGMKDGLLVVQNVEQEQLANIVSDMQTQATEIGTTGASIVQQITQAVTDAGIQLKNLEELAGQAGKTGNIFNRTNNTQGTGYVGVVDGKVADVVPEYDSKGNFLFYRYKIRATGATGTTDVKPSIYTAKASGGPADGLTLTGELGTEMAILPDGTVKMLGANGRGELVDLPVGTQVLNAEDTKEILKYTGPISDVPKLANGNVTRRDIADAYLNTAFGGSVKDLAAASQDLKQAVNEDTLTRAIRNAVNEKFNADKELSAQIVEDATNNVQTALDVHKTATSQTLNNNTNKISNTLDAGANSITATDIANTQALQQSEAEHVMELIASGQANAQIIVSALNSMQLRFSAAGSGLTGATGFIDPLMPQTVFDGTKNVEVPTYMLLDYVMNSSGEVDWSATAVKLAGRGYWEEALDALDQRALKIQALGTDYGISNEDVYAKALAAYNQNVIDFENTEGHGYLENVRGYLSIGSIQNALDEFDKRGYAISLTGNDDGISQEALWNESLKRNTGLTYKQWLSMHDSTGYNALNKYDPDAVTAMFDNRIPLITDEVETSFSSTADTLLNGDRVNLDNFKDFCDTLSATGLATINKDIMRSIEASHEDSVDVVTALKALGSMQRSTLSTYANGGLRKTLDAKGIAYRTDDGMYAGATGPQFNSVDLSADYHAKMAAAAAAGDWAAFDIAAAQREAKMAVTGTAGKYENTNSLAYRFEQLYKRNGSARGSLISEEGLYYAGEEGKQEAIIPLEQPAVLDKLGNAIGPYVDGSNVFDYTGNIEDASVVIKEANEVAIHGAVAALLEGNGSDKDAIIEAIISNTDRIIEVLGGLNTTVDKAQGSSSNTGSISVSDGAQSSSQYTGPIYTPSIKTPTSSLVYYDSNVDYHSKMAEYAAAGNWAAFDIAAAQRDAKMADDPELSKWKATDTLREQFENLYRRHGSAEGSIISKEGLYYAAEKDRQEAIIPLEQPGALSLVGEAISEYVSPTFGNIDDAAVVIKEGNEVAIHGAVAAIIEALKANKDEIIIAIKEVTAALGGSQSDESSDTSNSVSGGNSSSAPSDNYQNNAYTGPIYTPSVKTPTSSVVYYDSNVDYHSKMAQYAASGNWAAFDIAATQRDAKMADDPSLNKWKATDTLREQLESLYKRHGSASGSIIDEEGLYYAAEQNRQEAIIPLESPSALSTVGEAIGQYASIADYTGTIDDAAVVIKEGNEVAIHAAVAALLEGFKAEHTQLAELITSCKDEIVAALGGNILGPSQGSSGSSSTGSSGGSYDGGSSTYTGPTYMPSVKTSTSSLVYYDSNVDYHSKMAQYAAAGNWAAFDIAASQRDAKMAADPELSKWKATDTLREQFEQQYKRNGSAMGSLISAPGLYYAGEMGLNEAIIPLEQPEVLRKVGASIASFMPVNLQQQMGMVQGMQNGGIGTTTTYAPQPATDPRFMTASVVQSVLESVLPQIANMQGEQEVQDKRPLYVGTLVADERGLKALERKLYDIRQTEAGRR